MNDRHPGCALLAEVRRREYDVNPAVGMLVDRLSTAFGCEASLPAAFCPFPGLLAYDWGRDQARAKLFFGREAQTEALIGRLRNLAPGNLLVVSGASGCGKSSLVKAGLWRGLHDPREDQKEHIDASPDWAVSARSQSTSPASSSACSPAAPPGS